MSAVPETLDLSLLARQYVTNGWALVPLPGSSKRPSGNEWNLRENCVTTVDQCPRVKGNVGLALLYSRVCILDLDDMVKATSWLSARGIDIQELWNAPDAVRISSGKPNRGKLVFTMPEDVALLQTHNMQAEGLELRCGTAKGKTVQDVLPPSIHPDTGRPYAWEYAEPMIGDWRSPPPLPAAVLKAWLALDRPERLERVQTPSGVAAAEVRKLLGNFDPSESYPDWVRRGMALHHEFSGSDEGLSLWDEWSSASASLYVGLEDLETHWRTFGKDVGEVVTLDSLRAEISKRPAAAADFDDIRPQTYDLGPKAKPFQVQTLMQFSGRKAPGWIIKGILPRASMAVLYGASGAGKSFFVFDMVAAIARGADWCGHRTAKGRVVYVCAEGANGFRCRVDAYARHNEIDLADIEMGVIADAPNLMNKDQLKALMAELYTYGKMDVIVIDTYARAMPGGNENDSKDTGVMITACEAIHKETGALVLLVHHTGKDDSRGARGSNALYAAADCVVKVTRSEQYRGAIIEKMKDGEDGAEMGFQLNTIVLGVDEDGDDITSCVVEHKAVVPKAERKQAPKGANEKRILRYLTDHQAIGLDEMGRAEMLEKLKAELPEPDDKTVKDRRLEYLVRSLKTLVAGNWITDDGFKLALK